MGKVTGFIEIERHDRTYKPASDRIRNYKEFVIPLEERDLERQAARCMDCGIPFCHNGCPVNNQIPDWNDLVYNADWEEASRNLHSTNNFPEFTGRICPAPCEAACTLNIDDNPVTIKTIECAIVDKAWEEGWIVPQITDTKTGKKVAIVGAGPAGMAAAQQLARVGHDVHLFEKNEAIGGLLRFGIPDFKMEKHLIDRRAEQMVAEGVTLHCGVHVGVDITAAELDSQHDAVLLCGGSETPRDLPVDGRNLEGVHFAMEFLGANTKSLMDSELEDGNYISANGKHVVVIGGGDTGTDCVGTSLRHGCEHVQQLEIMPQPANSRTAGNPWPQYSRVLKVDYGQEEAIAIQGDDPRSYLVTTKKFVGDEDGNVKELHTCQIEWQKQDDGRMIPVDVPGSEKVIEADLVLLAMGFLGPEGGVLDQLGVEKDPRSNAQAEYGKYATNVEGVFAAGDARRGQSLIVWAINEGRGAAQAVDAYLMGKSYLPR